jgi:hypothetical protein
MHATLYLGGQPVTTEINKQIQFAAQSKQMLEYIADKFQWTDAQATTTVNWRALGIAKRRMKLYRSVRTTKMLYSWLNVGTQKGKMGEDSICPCCGIDIEDQLHMYQCQDERVTQNLDAAIASFQSKLVKDGLTTPTYTAIVNMVCQAAHRPPLSTYNIKCEHTLQCIEAQHTLGTEAILRGFHHVDWLQLIRNTWVPPPEPLPGEKKIKRKDPLEQSVSVITGVWDIFESVWECRNGILHSNESKLIERSNEEITEKLLNYKRHNITLLRRCDRFIIDSHTERDVIRWPLSRKKAVLDLLDNLIKVFTRERRRDKALYRDIREIFKPKKSQTNAVGVGLVGELTKKLLQSS